MNYRRIINFEPRKRFSSIDEAIREAIDKAKKTGDAYRFDCNGLPMVIDCNSDAEELLERYWKYDHEQGVTSGRIVTVPFKYPAN